MVEKIINWLVVSSSDPQKASLTIKGILLTYASFVILTLHTLNVPLTENEYVTYVSLATTVLGGIFSIFGICRKIYFEILAVQKKTK